VHGIGALDGTVVVLVQGIVCLFEIAALETKLAKTRSLKQGMMHNLLTGKIRLL